MEARGSLSSCSSLLFSSLHPDSPHCNASQLIPSSRCHTHVHAHTHTWRKHADRMRVQTRVPFLPLARDLSHTHCDLLASRSGAPPSQQQHKQTGSQGGRLIAGRDTDTKQAYHPKFKLIFSTFRCIDKSWIKRHVIVLNASLSLLLPPLSLQEIVVCGHSLEVNVTSSLDVYVSVAQVQLLQQLLRDNMVGSYTPEKTSEVRAHTRAGTHT